MFFNQIFTSIKLTPCARWVNRPEVTEEDVALALKEGSVQSVVNQSLQKMINTRQQNEVFGVASTEIFETYNDHLFAYCRMHENGQKMLAICNFSEASQSIAFSITDVLASDKIQDLLSSDTLKKAELIELEAYKVLWLVSGHCQLM